jgi:hypothetical protein
MNTAALIAIAAAVSMVAGGAGLILMSENASADEYTGATFNVTMVEGTTWSYTPSYSITGVTTTISGTAAAWLSVSGGTISGTAPAITDSFTSYTLTIKAETTNPTQTAYQYVNFTVYRTLVLSGGVPQITHAGASMNIPLTANHAGVTWSATDLPAGLSINPNTGVISGTITAAGNKTATITGTHIASGQIKTMNIEFTVSGALNATSPANMYCINGVPLPTNTSDPDYYRLTASLSGVTFALKSGSVSGLTVNSDGTITGTPTSMGEIPLVITMTHAASGQTVDFTVTVHVVAPLTFGSLPTGAILVTPG